MAIRPLTIEELAHLERSREKDERRQREAAERDFTRRGTEVVKKPVEAPAPVVPPPAPKPELTLDVSLDASLSVNDLTDSAKALRRRKP